MTNADQPALLKNGKPDLRTEPEKLADLWIAVNMPEMKPRSIIPLVKRAYLSGYKLAKRQLETPKP